MRMKSTGCVVVAALLLAGAAQAQETRAAIEAANRGFVAAYAKGNAAAVAAFYSSTAEVFPPNADTVKGTTAIAGFWQAVMDSGVATAELNTSEVHAEGNLAYEVGTYAMKGKDGNVLDRGKYCVVWMKESGQWKVHRDIWNTSVPAQGKE